MPRIPETASLNLDVERPGAAAATYSEIGSDSMLGECNASRNNCAKQGALPAEDEASLRLLQEAALPP